MADGSGDEAAEVAKAWEDMSPLKQRKQAEKFRGGARGWEVVRELTEAEAEKYIRDASVSHVWL